MQGPEQGRPHPVQARCSARLDAFVSPEAPQTEAQRSGFGLERRSGGMSELCPQGKAKDMQPATTLSRYGLGARPGRQLLRLRADPGWPAAVPGLCPSASESVPPACLSYTLLIVTLRLFATFACPYPFCPFGTFPPDRGNRPFDSGHERPGLWPVLVRILRSGPGSLLTTAPRFSVALPPRTAARRRRPRR